MLRTVVVLQLTLWVASIHAFYPFIPQWQCEENGICGEGSKSGSSEARDVVTYRLSQREPRKDHVDPSTRAIHEASRLRHKHRQPLRTSFAEVSRRENKYTIVPPATPTTANSAGLYQDGIDFSYFLQIGIGSAGKPLYMLLDTGAGTTWVMGTGCDSTACSMHNSFGPEDSTTYTKAAKTFSISYGTGQVAGDLAKDSFAVAGLKVDLTFGVANTTSADFTHFPFDGILGMSMSNGATDNFLKVVKDSKALQSNVFAVTLSRNGDGGTNTGEVTFGGTDASKFTGDIQYTPVSTKAGGDWAIALDDIAYDGNKAGLTGRLAYIDTGTSYMFGPPKDVAALHKLIPGSTTTDGGTYTVPCDSTKVLTVSFGGVAYTISPKDWMSPPAGDTCTSNFYGYVVVEGAWLLGDSFLKNVYTVFDAEKSSIGLALKAGAESAGATTSSAATTTSATSPTGTVSSGADPSTVVTTVTPTIGSATTAPFFPGLTGHETSITADAPASQTAGTAGGSASASASATARASSPGDQLAGNKYASIICIVAVIAMVA